VLARGCDTNNSLYKTIWNGSSWSTWTKVHGSTYTCLLGAPAIANPFGGNLYAYYRGCNNLIYETKSTDGGQNWTADVSTGNCALSPPGAAAISAYRVDIVFRSCNNNLVYHAYRSIPVGGWVSEAFSGTCTMVAPGIASWTAGTLDVLHRGCGPASAGGEGIFRSTFSGSSWTPWALMPQTCTASGIGMDAWAPDRLDGAYRSCTPAYQYGPAFVVKAYRSGTNANDPWSHIWIGNWP
jgi:hypothetical protein